MTQKTKRSGNESFNVSSLLAAIMLLFGAGSAAMVLVGGRPTPQIPVLTRTVAMASAAASAPLALAESAPVAFSSEPLVSPELSLVASEPADDAPASIELQAAQALIAQVAAQGPQSAPTTSVPIASLATPPAPVTAPVVATPQVVTIAPRPHVAKVNAVSAKSSEEKAEATPVPELRPVVVESKKSDNHKKGSAKQTTAPVKKAEPVVAAKVEAEPLKALTTSPDAAAAAAQYLNKHEKLTPPVAATEKGIEQPTPKLAATAEPKFAAPSGQIANGAMATVVAKSPAGDRAWVRIGDQRTVIISKGQSITGLGTFQGVDARGAKFDTGYLPVSP